MSSAEIHPYPLSDLAVSVELIERYLDDPGSSFGCAGEDCPELYKNMARVLVSSFQVEKVTPEWFAITTDTVIQSCRRGVNLRTNQPLPKEIRSQPDCNYIGFGRHAEIVAVQAIGSKFAASVISHRVVMSSLTPIYAG